MTPPPDLDAAATDHPASPPSRTPVSSCPPTEGVLRARDGDMFTLDLPGTDYRLDLMLDGLLEAEVGDRVEGTIHAEALRVDVIAAGGRYVEPVYGRPRRVQGTIVGGDLSAGSGGALFVNAGRATLACTLTDPRQNAADFTLHQMVSFDVRRGACFKPVA